MSEKQSLHRRFFFYLDTITEYPEMDAARGGGGEVSGRREGRVCTLRRTPEGGPPGGYADAPSPSAAPQVPAGRTGA